MEMGILKDYEKMEPCPKCGKDGTNLKLETRPDHSKICVVCRDCNLEGPYMYYAVSAIRAWNTMTKREGCAES